MSALYVASRFAAAVPLTDAAERTQLRIGLGLLAVGLVFLSLPVGLVLMG